MSRKPCPCFSQYNRFSISLDNILSWFSPLQGSIFSQRGHWGYRWDILCLQGRVHEERITRLSYLFWPVLHQTLIQLSGHVRHNTHSSCSALFWNSAVFTRKISALDFRIGCTCRSFWNWSIPGVYVATFWRLRWSSLFSFWILTVRFLFWFDKRKKGGIMLM